MTPANFALINNEFEIADLLKEQGNNNFNTIALFYNFVIGANIFKSGKVIKYQIYI